MASSTVWLSHRASSATYTVTITNASGCSATASKSVTVNPAPVMICPVSASVSRLTNPGLCTYSILGNEFNATVTANCSVSNISYNLTGSTTGTGTSLAGVKLYTGTTTVTWSATAPGKTLSCTFMVTVKDDQNPTDYIIYAANEVKFGEYNYINGNVGVTAANGKASFKKNDVLPNPFFVRTKNIEVDAPSSVSNKIYSAATDGPNPTFFTYSGNTTGLSNYTVSSNSTLSGNYKDLTIKKGVVATIQGNNFGKITVEEGAQVTFSSGVINLENLDIKGGKKDESTTNVYFSKPTSVLVKAKVNIDDNSRVNVGGPKVTFHLGDNKGDEEKFTVKADNSEVTANIMIPNGKLKVNGGESRMSIMTGWYIVDKLESTGKYITWNKYNCSMAIPLNIVVNQQSTINNSVYENKQAQDVTIYPNPAKQEVWMNLKSFEGAEMTLILSDILGKPVQQHQIQADNIVPYHLNVGDLSAGLYFITVHEHGKLVVTRKLQVTK